MAKIEQFAVILFTLRDFIKTKEGFVDTLDKVAKIGYKAIQISGMAKDVVSEEEIVALCKERGLTICGTHEPGVDIFNNTEAVIERLKKLGTEYTAYPFPSGVDFKSEESIQQLIHNLDQAGAKLSSAGLTLLYHNHNHEFVKSGDKTILRRIYDEISPEHLQGEIDTHWVQRGGGDPVAWINSLSGRMPLLHIKDYKINDDIQPDFAEIGNGNLDFPAIIKAGDSAGVKFYIVEQDTCPGDPFDSIAQSFDYIKKHLVS